MAIEYVQLQNNGDIEKLASALASLHKNTSEQFGFYENNYIGLTKQKNDTSLNWIKFYLGNRIDFQINLLEEKFNVKNLKIKQKLLRERVYKLFNNYSPKPSLLHGDLWQGNYAFDEAGDPVIYDPACYYGDHETDLAMLELFGNPGTEFFKAYHQQFPIDAGYGKRKVLYNLYHILNHANLFGGSYFRQAETMMDQILAFN